jgi:L-alanine-DL-glutamate epimerase-like enolase superfamily enzyme
MARAANGLAWTFVELETNAGITGIAYSEGAGPVRAFIHEQLSDLVVGADPFETEKIWNDMFWRVRGNGRKGAAFQAISAIDNTIWDIKAKALKVRCTGCSARRMSTRRSTVPAAGQTTRPKSSFVSSARSLKRVHAHEDEGR